MTDATVTIPGQADYYVTAAASGLASSAQSRAQTGALKSWKDTMSSRLARCKWRIGRRYEDADERQGH